jgi:hypothetical protein
LIAGDLAGYRQEVDEVGRARFVPDDGGPAFAVASRVEKRVLGRTEIAVFNVDLGVSFPEKGKIELAHTGRLKRTGVTASSVAGGQLVRQLASRLGSDRPLSVALQPLDFTRFEIFLGPEACHAEAELMGASHVAAALPPIRSYVHLHPDQRNAMVAGMIEVDRAIRTSV